MYKEKRSFFWVLLIGGLFVFTTSSFAEKKRTVPHYYPFEKNISPKKDPTILRDEFELGIDKPVAKSVYRKIKKYKRIISGTVDMSFLNTPIYIPLRNIDSLYVHPEFLTTITFPSKYEITGVRSSMFFENLSFSKNVLLVQPLKNFMLGNIVVGLKAKNGKRSIVNIRLERYDRNMLQEVSDKELGEVKLKQYFSLFYNYVDEEEDYNIDKKIDIFKKYVDFKGIKNRTILSKVFKNNGSWDAIVINNKSYYITRNDIFGDIEFMGYKFSIDNSIVTVENENKEIKENNEDSIFIIKK